MAGAKNNVKVKTSEYFSPSGLVAGEFLGVHDVLKILVISIHNGVESVWVAF
jgi:hypothetical protein